MAPRPDARWSNLSRKSSPSWRILFSIWLVSFLSKAVTLIRVVTLNLNHRTRPMPVPLSLIRAISALEPDAVVFTEYVESAELSELRQHLDGAGFSHVAVSENVEYQPGRWHNQILIASRDLIDRSSLPSGGPDAMSRTNTLSVRTLGLWITGLRVPAYKSARDWYVYWLWLNDALEGDLVIGDFNADPNRKRKWDRVLDDLVIAGGWSFKLADGIWSYRGTNGTTSKVDHAIVRGHIKVKAAQYVQDPFVPRFTDHAALVVDVEA